MDQINSFNSKKEKDFNEVPFESKPDHGKSEIVKNINYLMKETGTSYIQCYFSLSMANGSVEGAMQYLKAYKQKYHPPSNSLEERIDHSFSSFEKEKEHLKEKESLKKTGIILMEQVQKQQSAYKELQEKYKKVVLSTDCSLCGTEKRQVLFTPCNHFTTCISCAEILQFCPTCENPIQKKIKARF